MTTLRKPEDEAAVDSMRSILGRTFVRALRNTHHPRAEEYIQEAEHQDGAGYWDQFADSTEMWEDFRLYLTY